MLRIIRRALLPVVLGFSVLGHAQVQQPKLTTDELRDKYGTDCAYANVFGGPLISLGGTSTKASGMAGFTFGQYFAAPLGKGLGATPQFELGLVGPLPSGNSVDGLVGLGYAFIQKIPHRALYPSLSGGYSRFFVTGNAVNFGAAIDIGTSKQGDKLVRIEVKDYFLFTGPQQHVISFRIGIGKLIAD